MTFVDTLRDKLSRYRFCFDSELKLQNQLQQVFEAEGYAFSREHRLSSADIPDFLLEGGVAIEVKVRGSVDVHLRQLKRYAQYDAVAGIILVIPKGEGMPETVAGKPCAMITLWKNRL